MTPNIRDTAGHLSRSVPLAIVRLMPLNEPYRTKADLYGTRRDNVPFCPAGGITPPPYFPIVRLDPLFSLTHSQPNGPPVRQLAKPYPENPHEPNCTHGLASRHDRHR